MWRRILLFGFIAELGHLLLFTPAHHLQATASTELTQTFPLLEALRLPLLPPEGRVPGYLSPEHFKASAIYLVSLGLSFAGYGLALRALLRGARPRRVLAPIAGWALVFALTNLFHPEFFSADPWSYIVYGRLLGIYGENPYVVVPSQYPDDPFLPRVYTDWQSYPSDYGPIWTWVSAAAARLAGDSVASNVLVFRATAALGSLVTALLVWDVARRLRPALAPAALVFYAWNPLVLRETVGGAHNDAWQMLFVLAALRLLLTGRGLPGIGALAGAVLVKASALLLLPAYGLLLVRRQETWAGRLRVALAAGALVAAVLVVGYAPFWANGASVRFGQYGASLEKYANSVPELLFRELRRAMGESERTVYGPGGYEAYWVKTLRPTDLHAAPSRRAEVLLSRPAERSLLVYEDPEAGWLPVLDPSTHQRGWVFALDVAPWGPLPGTPQDAEIKALERGALGNATSRLANWIVRLATGAVFALVWAALSLGARTAGLLVRSWVLQFVVLLSLAASWFWPWYAVWPVALAALRPASATSRYVVLFSGSVLLLYLFFGLDQLEGWQRVVDFRSIVVFGLPLLGFLVAGVVERLRRPRPAREWRVAGLPLSTEQVQ